MNRYPYIKINYTLETDVEAIEKDVDELNNILERFSVAMNQEIILIIGNEVYRIDESDKSSN